MVISHRSKALQQGLAVAGLPVVLNVHMSPTILREGSYRLFFFSREEPRIHVHVSHPDGEAKFWLTPEVHLATSTGLSSQQLHAAQLVVETHIGEIKHAWHKHFGS